jgi:retinol dehydrogenase-12
MDIFMNSSAFKDFIKNNKLCLVGLLTASVCIYISKRFYFSGGRCKSRARLDGKTVIITGANTGIGYETAIDLAKRGARIILACRDIKKAVKAAEEIRLKSGNGNVITEYLDLASLESVKKFAIKMNEQEERLDILINNAGIMSCPHWKTFDGLEVFK